MILSETVYTLYWNRNIQFRTPNEDVIKLFLLRATDRGEKLSNYHINSNVAPGYDIEKFILGEKLPLCWQTN